MDAPALKGERAAMSMVLTAVWYAGLIQRIAPQGATVPTIVVIAACPQLVDEKEEDEDSGNDDDDKKVPADALAFAAEAATTKKLRGTLLALAAEAGVQVLTMKQYIECWCTKEAEGVHAQEEGQGPNQRLELQRKSLRAAHLRQREAKKEEEQTGTVGGYTAYTVTRHPSPRAFFHCASPPSPPHVPPPLISGVHEGGAASCREGGPTRHVR
jgi:hypothetical protein